MITAVICVFAALWVAGLAVFLFGARRAPLGFEDAAGFHTVDEEHAQHEHVLGSAVRAG